MPTPRTPLSPPPGQTSLAARLAAPDQVDQVGGTLKCQVCGSANLEELCHEPPHPRFLCLDCNSGLNSDGHAMPAPAAAGQGVGTLPQLAQVKASCGECANQHAFCNLCWLAGFQKTFAHLSQHREGLSLFPASSILHDVPDAAHEEVEIARIKGWCRATCGEKFIRLLDHLSHEDFVSLLVHAVSSVQRGKA